MEKLLSRKTYRAFCSRVLCTLLVLGSAAQLYGQVGLGLRRTPTPLNQEIELSYANPREYLIENIEVEGLETLDKNALISLSGLKIGDKIRIPGEATANAIRKLMRAGIIGDVAIYITEVEGNKASLLIRLSERPRLTRINLTGVNKTQKSELNEDLDLIKGRVLSDAVVKNAELAVRDYFVEKGYLNVDIRVLKSEDSIVTNGVALEIQVDKKAKVKIDQIYITGNEAFGDNKLKGKMKKTNEKLRFHMFKEIFRTAISIRPKTAWQFLTRSYEMDSEEIKEYLADQVNVNFFKTSKFKYKEYRDDKKALIDFYNSKGYRDATLLSDSIERVNNKNINVHLHVSEGQRYYFRDIIWSGNFVHTDQTLNSILGVQTGDVYDMELINKKLTFNPNGPDISSLYMDNGYLFFNVNPVEVRVKDDSIDVEMRVYEGDQARINRVIVKGNDRTNDHVILRELRTLPGDYFSRSLLIRTQRELSQLGYFDPEQMGINPLPNPANGTVDIEYDLVERPSDQVELSGGWGGFYGFVGTVGLVFNNFSLRNITNFKSWRPLPVGDGQRLQLRIQANGRQFQNYSISFTEPWLGGKKPNSFSFGVNRSVVRTFPFYNVEQGTMKMTTFNVGLGKRLRWPDDYFTLSHSLQFSLYEFDNFVSSDNQQIGFNTGIARNFLYNVTLSRNSIDNPMFPKSGSSISLSLNLTPPYSLFNDINYETATPEEKYGWIEYHKWMFDASFYQQLVGKLVFSARAHLGFIDTYSDKASPGPFDRFQLGGSGLSGNNWIIGYDVIALRGYDEGRITPPNYAGSIQPNDIRGGVAYNKFVFELRYPVTASEASTIYVLGFAEAGNNFGTLEEYNPFSLYRSAGVGARIFMPAFGLMGIDWGYGFDQVPNSGSERSGGQFHFSIGQQIR